MCYSLAGIICTLVQRMGKQIVRVKESYPDWEFVGVEAVILKRDKESVLLGFPLEGSIGWYDSAYSTEYRC